MVRPLLAKADRDRLLPLIYRHAHGTFSGEDEAELRQLIAKEYPDRARRLDRESLMGLAHGIIGVAYYFGDRGAEANA